MPILTFKLNHNLFFKDPQTTDLGQNIISASIRLIDDLGFELFTFKKLASEIESTEASIYRYFENKHRILLYLIDMYWTLVEYNLNFSLNNIDDPEKRLRIFLEVLTSEPHEDNIAFYDQHALHRLVMSEFEKTYLTKQVDDDNDQGLFIPYKAICKELATIITKINPAYPFPNSLASTVLLARTHQLYYAQHLTSLSDIAFNPKTHQKKLYEFLESMVSSIIKSSPL